MTIDIYLSNINKRFILGNATEHTFRGDLQQLIESLVPEVSATNEPKRQAVGAPDYILTRKGIPVGFIEAKDIGDKDLAGTKKTGNKEQFDRYKAGLNNLIFTDYIDFYFYRDAEFITKIAIAEIKDHTIVALPENFSAFTNLLKSFCTHIGQTIKSPQKLAKMMAGKARLLSDVIEKAITSDEESYENSTIRDQKNAFKEILIHDITPKGFADVYAQTIAYGLFAARLHDPSLNSFTRQEAAELIPKSNPFLRKLFGYIAGPDIDDRIKWIVDDLADIFLACNVVEILKNYGKSTKMEDPIIHFYETFLSEYDPKLRKARGVWYTPAPVVSFIVRAVDDILKTEFNLPQGLADTSKTKISVNTQIPDKRSTTGYKQVEQEVHKVQILDPATGTGTFLSEVVKHIHKKFAGQQGIWSNYVETHLIPRLNGFELLMASYAMAHLQMDLLLTETGYKPTRDQRFKIYLTNSLEEHHADTGTLFANWLSSEANEANHIKRDTPVMCVIGNPPYAVSSTNKGDWIEGLTADYKKDLKEKSYNSLSDDYVKFIRYGQHFIEKNGSGVLAYITNNSFVSGVVHRQMRKSLVETFDDIFIINLHGSSKTNESSPDGSIDENVFDIQQGVSINIFIKKGKRKKEDAIVNYCDLWGKRESKYEQLSISSLYQLNTQILNVKEPNYYFQPIDDKVGDEFYKGFSPIELFVKYSSGVQTEFDAVAIQDNERSSETALSDISELTVEDLLIKYNLSSKSRIKFEKAKEDLKSNPSQILPLLYRPFEARTVLYTGQSNGIMGRPRKDLMQHMFNGDNTALVIKRARLLGKEDIYNHCFLSKDMIDKNFLSDQSYCLPLYLHPESTNQQSLASISERTPNLNPEIVNEIAERLGLTFTHEKETTENAFAPIDILDYIYAVLHSPTYREKYKEFLKIDFPRVPYPKDTDTFWKLVKLGGEIRQIHLLESPVIENYITQYPVDGDNVVSRKMRKTSPGFELTNHEEKAGKVWINDQQYFDNVPEVAWNFFIGGYQPAQKWLKDRNGRELEFDDILHYQKIIVALTETERLMKEIDRIEF